MKQESRVDSAMDAVNAALAGLALIVRVQLSSRDSVAQLTTGRLRSRVTACRSRYTGMLDQTDCEQLVLEGDHRLEDG